MKNFRGVYKLFKKYLLYIQLAPEAPKILAFFNGNYFEVALKMISETTEIAKMVATLQ